MFKDKPHSLLLGYKRSILEWSFSLPYGTKMGHLQFRWSMKYSKIKPKNATYFDFKEQAKASKPENV